MTELCPNILFSVREMLSFSGVSFMDELLSLVLGFLARLLLANKMHALFAWLLLLKSLGEERLNDSV
jgi:uncharacterized membrane protein required for colicin V production